MIGLKRDVCPRKCKKFLQWFLCLLLLKSRRGNGTNLVCCVRRKGKTLRWRRMKERRLHGNCAALITRDFRIRVNTSSIVWNQADGWRCLSQVLHRSVNLSGFLPPMLEISLLFRISFCTLQIIVKLEVPKNISVRIFILFSTVIVIQMHKIRTCPGIIRRTYKAKYRTR